MSNLERFKSTKSKSLWKIFIYGMIEVLLFNLYLIFSSLGGTFNWTAEEFTTNPYGMPVQIINLVMVIVGFVLGLYIIIYLILLVTGSD